METQKAQPTISIYLVGPSSTGKTTLCNALAQKLAIPTHAYVTEIARQVMKDKGHSRETIGSLQMQQDIMEAHFERENALREDTFPIRLFDRSAIDPIIYVILTSKNAADARSRQEFLTQSEEFQEILGRYKSNTSFMVLLKPVPGWLVDDGVRSTENQAECTQIFKELLKELAVPYFSLGGECIDLQERVNAILRLTQIETDKKA
ncbi:hypothetical protein M413DRAFT_32214 [Hebeloma cylindrosporum]|uniref:NadR/Ttd14 AAA domain-containing protein n=1 Tax=Hebeloma cylindrosporum TaxID=76867 RepID=A0A0C2XD81_HEBCY|nr:hypothetical protein M413DRAFT_32214 [Hebeloma cylindrosporum h7]